MAKNAQALRRALGGLHRRLIKRGEKVPATLQHIFSPVQANYLPCYNTSGSYFFAVTRI